VTPKHQYLLDESKLPKAWYNINADLPVPPQPVLHPGTMEPVTPDFLSVLFPMSLILQEISTDRYVEIPEPVRDIYKLWRPTPLMRAARLEKMLDTPAHIYYKYEGVSPVGSHKPNTAVPQVYFNKEAGTRALATETGAGQWGSAMAMACNFFDLDLEIYMVKVSYHQKPYRRIIMENFDAQVYASPTTRTQAGRAALAEDPDSPGSLGIAISEAVETAATSGGTKKYALGSVLGHVLMHQTVIGLEALEQMEMAGEYPDFVIGCAGGGSGDQAATAPIIKMHTLGHTFMPPGIHAGGLRYHGMAPSVSALVEHGDIEARAVSQLETFAAAVQFSKAEGIIPAPESAHAIRVAFDEALNCKRTGEKKVIAFNLTGHGHFDMMAYEAYHRGELQDYEYPVAKVEEAMRHLPKVPGF
jgi:tryptophan synthase beta chain